MLTNLLFGNHRRISSNANIDPTKIPMSPTKAGIMRPDKHWVIKTPRNRRFSNPYNPQQECCAVTTDAVTFDVWQEAHFVARSFDEHAFEDRILGRRCNDDIELFVEVGDEEEFVLLKGCLEEQGFTVRAYVVQGQQKKGGKKIMKEIRDKVGYLVQELEYDEEVKITLGLLVEVVGKTKVLAVVKVDQETIDRLKGQEDATITDGGVVQTEAGPKVLGKVLGEIRNTIQVKFWVADEFVRKYFDGQGVIHHMPHFVDLVEREKKAEADRRRRDKKAAKKHRRMMTESTTTATTPSELSFGSHEDDAVKARQRVKQNEKRKKQQQRRREEARVEEAGEAKKSNSITFALENTSDSDDSGSNSSDSGTWGNYQVMGNALISSNEKGKVRIQQLPFQIPQVHVHQIIAENLSKKEKDAEAIREAVMEADEEAKKPRVKLPKMEHRKDSVKDSGSEDENADGGTKVIVAQSVEDIKAYMHAGNPIMVLHPEDDDDAARGWNMRYLGKGL